MFDQIASKLEGSRTRGAIRFVVGNSVKFTITTMIAAYVPTETKVQKVKLVVGAYAIGSMVADSARDRIDSQIDTFLESLDEIKNLENPTES